MMPFDYKATLSSVTRTVIKGHLPDSAGTSGDGKPGDSNFRTIRLARDFAVDVDTVWRAITQPDRLALWFAPVSGDLVLGGQYHVQGNARGTIRRCDPGSVLELTWEFGDDVSYVRVSLAASQRSNGAAALTLEHETPVTDHWAKFGPGAGGVGWDMALAGLESYLEETELPRDEDWWAEAAEPRAFLEGSSAAWRAAAVAAGEDESWARDAELRNTRFYVPEKPSGSDDANN